MEGAQAQLGAEDEYAVCGQSRGYRIQLRGGGVQLHPQQHRNCRRSNGTLHSSPSYHASLALSHVTFSFRYTYGPSLVTLSFHSSSFPLHLRPTSCPIQAPLTRRPLLASEFLSIYLLSLRVTFSSHSSYLLTALVNISSHSASFPFTFFD